MMRRPSAVYVRPQPLQPWSAPYRRDIRPVGPSTPPHGHSPLAAATTSRLDRRSFRVAAASDGRATGLDSCRTKATAAKAITTTTTNTVATA
jgi:hypothetical protein